LTISFMPPISCCLRLTAFATFCGSGCSPWRPRSPRYLISSFNHNLSGHRSAGVSCLLQCADLSLMVLRVRRPKKQGPMHGPRRGGNPIISKDDASLLMCVFRTKLAGDSDRSWPPIPAGSWPPVPV
jgi:hypothetical protein